MSTKKLIIGAILTAIVSLALFSAVLTSWLGREEESTTLERIAYDKSWRESVVYIREADEYVPYLVLAADYGGNVLLLRENLLPEKMPYKPAPYEDGVSGLSGGWTHYAYGSYYEESSIDEFLNTDFLNGFSTDVQEAIVDTTIEVTDKESYDKWNYATHMLKRKVFLLSSVELGVRGSDGYTTAKEGTPLKYFKNTEHPVKRCYKADGTAWPYWSRTPWLNETCLVTVIGVDAIAAAPADKLLGVRPAFCMRKDTAVQKSDGIIDGESVYVLELECE